MAGTSFSMFGSLKVKLHNVFITCERIMKKTHTTAAYSACVIMTCAMPIFNR